MVKGRLIDVQSKAVLQTDDVVVVVKGWILLWKPHVGKFKRESNSVPGWIDIPARGMLWFLWHLVLPGTRGGIGEPGLDSACGTRREEVDFVATVDHLAQEMGAW